MPMYGHSMQSGGALRKGRRAVPNASMMAGLFLAVLLGNREVARPVQAFSDDIPCPTEALFCLADGECSDCVDALRTLSAETLSDFETCSELNGRVCQILETEPGCDTTNSNLVEFARCVAEEMFGCDELAECSEFPIAEATPAPMASMTDAMMSTGTPVSTVSVAPTSAPAMARDIPTSMPTSAPSAMDPTGSPTPSPSMVGRGIDLVTEGPTAVPTAAPTNSDGERGIDISTPAPAVDDTDEAEATSGSSTSFTTSSTLIRSLVAIGAMATAWMAL